MTYLIIKQIQIDADTPEAAFANYNTQGEILAITVQKKVNPQQAAAAPADKQQPPSKT